MNVKDSFTSDEWARVVGAPMVAGMAVTAADPSGLVGAVQESFSVAGSLAEVKRHGSDNPLVAEVVASYESAEGRGLARETLRELRGKPPAELAAAAVAELGAIAALVASKAPDAAPGYRAWLRGIAAKVAEAGTEGGFLGFGGVKVSEAEKATLSQVDAALA
jgi:hypothetical protein